MRFHEVGQVIKKDGWKLVYPIILTPFENHSGGYTVEFPDLPGCVTEGSDLVDAMVMAEDAASL